MRRIPWLFVLLVGCNGTPAGQTPVPAIGESPAPGEVAVVERVPRAGPEAAQSTEGAAPASIADLYGLETWKGWFAEEWDGTNPAAVTLEDHAKMGQSLRIDIEGGKGDKSAVGKPLAGSYVGKDGLRVDFFNPQPQPLKAAVGLFLSARREYFESPMITLPSGYSTHTIPLSKPVWKCRQTGWRHEAEPQGLDHVTQLDILVYSSGKASLLVPYIEAPEKIEEKAEEKTEEKVEAPTEEKAGGKNKPAPAATGILTPEEEKRLMEKLSAEDREAIREVLGTLEE